jgi:hypothetical protein
VPVHGLVLNEASPAVQPELKPSDPPDPERRASSSGEQQFDRCVDGFVTQDEQDDSSAAYSEEAFQYFLEIERKRSEISNRPFLLMLIDFKKHPGLNPHIDPATAGQLFSILSRSLRDTDFVGWYREGRVAGAVLTQHGAPEGDDLSEAVRQRVGTKLDKQLSPHLANGLQMRIYHLSPNINLRGVQ